MKTLTGNIEIVRMLNRFGHGVSYSQLEENDTALCLQKLAIGPTQRVVIPPSIQPNVFANLAWDNIDRLEETPTGKGTSHRVNGIVVQAKVFGPFLPRAELPHIEKKKQRSVSAEYQALEVYVAGARVGPEPLPTRNVQEAEQVVKVALKKNLVRILARQMDLEHQAIPSWTGFNIRTRDQVSISEDVVEYLPTINAPATELSTVLEILNQSDCIRKKLLLETIVVVKDQALYAKASEIIWKQKELFPHILLRMGIFHTICNALSILDSSALTCAEYQTVTIKLTRCQMMWRAVTSWRITSSRMSWRMTSSRMSWKMMTMNIRLRHYMCFSPITIIAAMWQKLHLSNIFSGMHLLPK